LGNVKPLLVRGWGGCKKETLRRNGGCKPKPTAYEKTFIKELILLLFQ
jgi:hypothetical protein